MSREWLQCVRCRAQYGTGEVRYQCECGGLLSVERPAGALREISTRLFDQRLSGRSPLEKSGVWRFREAVTELAPEHIITQREGGTRLYDGAALRGYLDHPNLFFKHEGENPTGSFKDRGMTAAVSMAARLGSRAVACASTGNTSASLAAYAARAGMRGVVFVPAGKISTGKLAQTLAYGARCLAIRGDFDAAMRLVAEAGRALGLYLVNSLNPFRIEGQKTIVWELLQDLAWHPPDWIALPAGNLGNTSAFGKALREAKEAGWIKRVPRLLAVQAEGANPFYQSFQENFARPHKMTPETVATAIRIGDPVSYEKAREAIRETRGGVAQVSDAALLEAKRAIDRAGIGCEPASACSLAGVKQLRAAGVIQADDVVVCILTGNLLKDPDIILKDDATRAQLVEIEPTLSAVEAAL